MLVHALMDAILGAAAQAILASISDTDPQYAGASSISLLEQVRAKIDQLGWRIGNVDSVIVAQRPRLADYIPKMRAELAGALQADTGQVSVKATTTEGLGFVGAGEGIAAYAVVSLVKANKDEKLGVGD